MDLVRNAVYDVRDEDKWEEAVQKQQNYRDALNTGGFQNEAVPLLEEYLRSFEKRSDVVRLKLAQILIEVQQRPRYALRMLGELPVEPLKPHYEKLRQSLTRKAQRMIADGVLELSGRAW